MTRKKNKRTPRGKPASAERARTEKRRQSTKLRKTIEKLEKLAAQGPGGNPDNPIVVTSPAVIEGRARTHKCVRCEGHLVLQSHDSIRHGETRLRHLLLQCRSCHAARSLYFFVDVPAG